MKPFIVSQDGTLIQRSTGQVVSLDLARHYHGDSVRALYDAARRGRSEIEIISFRSAAERSLREAINQAAQLQREQR